MEQISEVVGSMPTSTPGKGTDTKGADTKAGDVPRGAPPKPKPRDCPHCGRAAEAEYVALPPALAKRYGRQGVWHYPVCTTECQEREDQREWTLATRQQKVLSLRKRSEMPVRLADATFSDFKVEENLSPTLAKARDACERYAAEFEERSWSGEGLYLAGPVGTGKTHLAAATARRLMYRRHTPTLFVTVPDLLDRMRPGNFGGVQDDREAWFAAAKGAELLVLDDLGAEKATEWAQERVFILINHRYRERLPTIFTSNLDPEELGEHLGERVVSRIVEVSEFVRVAGVDYRELLRREKLGKEAG